MIVYKDGIFKCFETRSDKPNEDWTGTADFVIDETNPENTELLSKIMQLAPCFDYVTDEDGNLIDVVKNDVVIPEPEEPEVPESVEDMNYDELADAIKEGVNEV